MLGMMALAIKILIPVARGPPGGRAEPRERPAVRPPERLA